jgi:hypothetical protein
MKIPPSVDFPTLKPLIRLASSVLRNILLRTSMTKRNNKGDKGSPRRRPLELSKKPEGEPFTIIEKCRHQRKIITTSPLSSQVFLAKLSSLFIFSLIPTPVWRVSLFFRREGMCVCVCVREHVCVCVHGSTNLESPPTMGNLRCDWAPMSNRFYLV